MDLFSSQLGRLKEEGGEIKKEIRERTLGYITAALGLVAGLAWNEAIKSLIDYFFPLASGGVWPKFAYAILATLIAVVAGVYFVKIGRRGR